MIHRLSQLFSWFVAILIFFIPSNLFFVLNENLGFVNGVRIDYLMPKIYFTDFVIILIIVIGTVLAQNKLFLTLKRLVLTPPFIFLSLIILGAQLFSPIPIVSFFMVIKAIEFFLLFLVLLLNKKYLNRALLIGAIVCTILLQLVFALYQHSAQQSLTPYWLLGESVLNSSANGLARGNFGGEERLLAYGTTPHPNVLAGVATLLSLLVLRLKKTKKNPYWLLVLPCIVLIYFTQSWSAAIALGLGCIGLLIKKLGGKKIVFIILLSALVIPLVIAALALQWDSPSIQRREVLNRGVVAMLEAKPLFGVGLGNFTAVLEKYMENKEFVRFIQPAHNVPWLVLAETGIVGGLLLWQLLRRIIGHYYVLPVTLALIPLLGLDHYLLTTQSGALTALLFILFSLKRIREEATKA